MYRITQIGKKHVKPNNNNQTGGIIDMEAKIDASNVMFLDNNKTTRKVVRNEKNKTKKVEKKESKPVKKTTSKKTKEVAKENQEEEGFYESPKRKICKRNSS